MVLETCEDVYGDEPAPGPGLPDMDHLDYIAGGETDGGTDAV